MQNEKMQWSKLLSRERWGHFSGTENTTAGEREFRSEFERDYGRILYSSAFRRLQDKTQVFPIGRNDYVRTRLTHSLEVANIGSSLGRIVGDALIERHRDLRELGFRASHFSAITAAACLAHDIGNPPFGHFGESAIESALEKLRKRGAIPEDFPGKFEGNAQGFRLLTRTGDPMAGRGLKLTAAVLGAFMKYPCDAQFAKKNGGEISAKKFGFVKDDEAAARFVAEKTGMLAFGKAESAAWRRHPLAFLTEAADDLSYLIADFEDAFVSKIISFEAVREFLFPFISETERSRADAIAVREGEESAVHYVRAVAVGAGIREVSRVFLSREDALLAGTQNKSLAADSNLADAMKALRTFSFANVYNAPSVVEIELMGFRVIEALLEFFVEWVNRPNSAKGGKIALMLRGTHLAESPASARLLHLLDFVSGMTDSFALATYRKLHGI